MAQATEETLPRHGRIPLASAWLKEHARIARARYSLMQLHGSQDTTILFDDYGDRRNYHVVERFARLERMAGRAGVFRVRDDVPIEDISSAFDRFMVDCGRPRKFSPREWP